MLYIFLCYIFIFLFFFSDCLYLKILFVVLHFPLSTFLISFNCFFFFFAKLSPQISGNSHLQRGYACLKGILLLPELFSSSLPYCLFSFPKNIVFHLNKIVRPILSCFALFDTSKYYLFGQLIANFVWGACLLSFSSPITCNNFWEENQQT